MEAALLWTEVKMCIREEANEVAGHSWNIEEYYRM